MAALLQLSTNFPISQALRLVTQEGNRFECGFGANTLHVQAAGDYLLVDETGRLIPVSTSPAFGNFNISCQVGIPNAMIKLDSGQALEVFSSTPG